MYNSSPKINPSCATAIIANNVTLIIFEGHHFELTLANIYCITYLDNNSEIRDCGLRNIVCIEFKNLRFSEKIRFGNFTLPAMSFNCELTVTNGIPQTYLNTFYLIK